MNKIVNQKSPHHQKGLSLVEIMIAVTISLVLLAGIIQIFVGTRQTYRVQESMSRIQENGRFAMEFLIRDIRQADFWGCNPDIIYNLLNGGADIDSFYNFTLGGIGGEDNTGLNGSDKIIFRGIGSSDIELRKSPMTTSSGDIRITTPNGIEQCDILFITNCEIGNIFQVTNANPDTSGSIAHNTGSTCDVSPGPGNALKDFNVVYGTDAKIYDSIVNGSFQIAEGSNGEPALFRTNTSNTVELVDGIEDMQVVYGEDTDDDGTPNYYVSANNVTNMDNVISVHVSIMVRSPEDNITDADRTYDYNGGTFTATDKRLRKIFSSTITLRNRI